MLYEPDTQLYLLSPDGQVLSTSSEVPLAQSFKVNMGPVMMAASEDPMPYVLGDNPERMDIRVVVAARALRPMSIAPTPAAEGYLYLVTRARDLTEGNPAALSSVLSQPVVFMVLAVVALSTLLAAWATASITRPLKRLTRAVGHIGDQGLLAPDPTQPPSNDHALGHPRHPQPKRIWPTRAGHGGHAANPATAMGHDASPGPLPTRRRQQPVARPPVATHRDHHLPGNAGPPLASRRGARARSPTAGGGPSQHPQRVRDWSTAWAIWPASTNLLSSSRPSV